MRFTRLIFSLGLASYLALGQPHASQALEQNLSGFASLGIVSSSNPDYAFRRDISQDDGSHDRKLSWRTDSILGLKWQGRWSYQLDSVVQLVAKDRFDNSLANSVEWAFVHYRPKDSWDLRLGRMGVDVFMLSEYREVGYAYPWVRPPQDTYGLLSLYHFNGADLNKRFDLASATLNLKLFYGSSRNRYPLDYHGNRSQALDFNPGGLSLNLERDNWKWRYSFVRVKVNNNFFSELTQALDSIAPYWPDAAELSSSLSTSNSHFSYHELGLSYDSSSWWLQTELVKLRSNTSLLQDSRLGYLSLGRHFGPWLVYLNSGRASPASPISTLAPPQGYPEPLSTQLQLLTQGINGTVNGARLDQHSWGLGTRWDFKPRMALKLQLDRVSFASQGSNLWLQVNPPAHQQQRSWVGSLSWDVIF